MSKLEIYTDGGARGNPGPAGIGVYIPGVGKFKKYLGRATNNQAEYEAVLWALEKAKAKGAGELDFYLDSELVVKQLNGEYRVKNKELSKLFVKIWNIRLGFKRVKFHHIPRTKNETADQLANEAMDDGVRG